MGSFLKKWVKTPPASTVTHAEANADSDREASDADSDREASEADSDREAQ